MDGVAASIAENFAFNHCARSYLFLLLTTLRHRVAPQTSGLRCPFRSARLDRPAKEPGGSEGVRTLKANSSQLAADQ